ncbi:MAG: hypothetical protein R3250_17650, partial [Melioribacteraceae bacterium]|nr:hypothetical protein [Melioribacteraceae bacterium]
LFGAGHIENVTNLALMTGGPVWNASRGMHSWERNKIDWIDYIDIPNHGNSTIVTKDYITSGEAYRLKLTDDEWYVIENHQKLSSNDWAKDKGIYVYHIIRTKNFAPQITVKCADGNWDFELDTLNGKLIKTQPNPTGKSEIDILIPTQKTKYACFEQVYGDNSAWGDRFDAFDPYYNNVISPVSNPSNQNRAGQDFIIYVKEKENENFIVDIYFDDIYQSSPPSKPQINDISIDDKGALKLTWLKNNEPDLAGYVLYAYIINEGNPELIESKNLNKHITSISISENLLQKNQKNALALASFDITEKESLKSDFIELIYNNDSEKWDWKRKETY